MAQGIEGTATNAAGQIIDSGVLGGLVIVLLAVCIGMFLRLNKVQNDRVDDQKQLSKKMEDLVEKLMKALTDSTSAQRELADTERQSQHMLQDISRSVQGVIYEAVRRGSSSTNMQAQRVVTVEPNPRDRGYPVQHQQHAVQQPQQVPGFSEKPSSGASRSSSSGRYSQPGGPSED